LVTKSKTKITNTNSGVSVTKIHWDEA